MVGAPPVFVGGCAIGGAPAPPPSLEQQQPLGRGRKRGRNRTPRAPPHLSRRPEVQVPGSLLLGGAAHLSAAPRGRAGGKMRICFAISRGSTLRIFVLWFCEFVHLIKIK